MPYVYRFDADHIVCVQVVEDTNHRYGIFILPTKKGNPRRFTKLDYPTADNAQFYVERYARKNGWLPYIE